MIVIYYQFEHKQIRWSHQNGNDRYAYYQVVLLGQEMFVIKPYKLSEINKEITKRDTV